MLDYLIDTFILYFATDLSSFLGSFQGSTNTIKKKFSKILELSNIKSIYYTTL